MGTVTLCLLQVRAALLAAYDRFLLRAFGEERLREAGRKPADERFAVATPGGAPWRRSLVQPGRAGLTPRADSGSVRR